MNVQGRKVALLILDGWGIGPDDARINAQKAANTPFLDSLTAEYPHARLKTSGEDVGLPQGQMGNSEVGHMNIGAGRIVWQQLTLINKSFAQGYVKDIAAWQTFISDCHKAGKPLHFMGLVSAGGVHSSLEHIKALVPLAAAAGIKEIYVHAFTDGRDTDPHSAKTYIADLQKVCDQHGAKIISVIGRYYAMDRDRRWQRTAEAYNLIVKREGEQFDTAKDAIEASYARGVTDEFITPKIIGKAPGLQDGDFVFFFNFRTDRGRQLVEALTQCDFPEQNMRALQLRMMTMTEYDAKFHGIEILFNNQNLQNTFGEVVASEGRTQLRVAETEKYPHVTFFFSGGREAPFTNEKRCLAPSPKVATYDLQPEMSAAQVADMACAEIQETAPDAIILNFANPDMVGHTGVFSAVVKALETVNDKAKQVVECALEHDYTIFVIADHGNSEFMVNEDGTPNTAHTTYEVPIIMINGPEGKTLNDGRLADVAPTLLACMGISRPVEMTGQILLR